MNYGCFTHPGPEASETGQGHAAGSANGRYATVLSANPARRAAQLPCTALARYPDRSASGIAYLAFLATMPPLAWPPPGRDLLGAGPAGRARYSPGADQRGRAGHACWSAHSTARLT